MECACKFSDIFAPLNKNKHRGKDYRTRKVWSAMIQRCYREKNRAYVNYGERGIRVCTQWLYSFDAFFADMGISGGYERTLDRINNDKGYCPHNCRWVSMKEQHENKRPSTLWRGLPSTWKVKESKKGYYTMTSSSKFYSCIRFKNKRIYLGSFNTKEQAILSYVLKFRVLHGYPSKLERIQAELP